MGQQSAPWRVFVSHTSELERFPERRSYVQAALDAIGSLDHVGKAMRYFPSLDVSPADGDAAQLANCQVYVGILGFRWGSRSDQDPTRSFTELEYDEAGHLGIPRLVFLLDPTSTELGMPPDQLGIDDPDRDRQLAFRERVQKHVIGYVVNADDLRAKLIRSLGALQLATTDLSSAHAAASPPANLAPRPPDHAVQRSHLVDQVVSRLMNGTATVGLTTALHGAGGFGKTTLAQMVCASPEVAEHFPGGIYWITLGEDLDSAGLITRIGDLIHQVSGTRKDFAGLEAAAQELGRALGDRQALVVIDDVWKRDHLAPFTMFGGRRCVRLVTTRQADVLPGGAAAIRVDEMDAAEARELLGTGLDDRSRRVDELRVRCAGWPVLLALVNGRLRADVARGISLSDAADYLLDGFDEVFGTGALDLGSEHSRSAAVGAILSRSIERLDPASRHLFLSMAVFPEDLKVHVDVLAMYLQLSRVQVRELCTYLHDAALVQSFDGSMLRLHDVVRSHLRTRADVDLRGLEGQMADALQPRLDALRSRLPGRLLPALDSVEHSAIDTYALRFGVQHLAASGRLADLERLALSPELLAAALAVKGLNEVESDLRLIARAISSPQIVRLHQRFMQSGHKLLGLSSPYLSLSNFAEWSGREVWAKESTSFIDAVTDMPDRPDPRLVRALAPNGGIPLRHCDISSDGQYGVFGDELGAITVWDLESGTRVANIAGTGRDVLWCMFIDDRLLASLSGEGRLTVWNYIDGAAVHSTLDHPGRVQKFAYDRAANSLVVLGYNGRCSLWSLDSFECIAEIVLGIDDVRSLSLRQADDAIEVAAVGTWGQSSRNRIIGGVASMSERTRPLFTAPLPSDVLALGDVVHFVLERSLTTWTHGGGQRGAVHLPDDVKRFAGRDLTRNRLALASRDGCLVIADLETNECSSLLGHRSQVVDVAFSADGQRFVSVSPDGSALVWRTSPENDAVVSTGGAHEALRSLCVVAHPQSTTCAVQSSSARVDICDASRGEVVRRVEIDGGSFLTLGVAPDAFGLGFVAGDSRGCIHLITSGGDESVSLFESPVCATVEHSGGLMVALSDGKVFSIGRRSDVRFVGDVPVDRGAADLVVLGDGARVAASSRGRSLRFQAPYEAGHWNTPSALRILAMSMSCNFIAGVDERDDLRLWWSRAIDQEWRRGSVRACWEDELMPGSAIRWLPEDRLLYIRRDGALMQVEVTPSGAVAEPIVPRGVYAFDVRADGMLALVIDRLVLRVSPFAHRGLATAELATEDGLRSVSWIGPEGHLFATGPAGRYWLRLRGPAARTGDVAAFSAMHPVVEAADEAAPPAGLERARGSV